MLMFRSVSGEPPTTPVVSKKSGLVYEARLIRKYIQENGKDPISGEELVEDDLLEIKASEYREVASPFARTYKMKYQQTKYIIN